MNGKKESISWIDRIDKLIVFSTLGVLAIFFTWAFTNTDQMGNAMNKVFVFATQSFGWFYLLMGFLFVVFAIWLAFGPFGNVKLGKEDEKPRYSFFSWFSMIIACGYGVGLVYWCVAEPLSIFQNPPFGLDTGTAEAAEISLAYSFFHWGWTPWAIYMAIAAPAGYFIFKKGEPPKFSTCLRPLFGDRVDGTGFKFLDVFLVIGVIGGVTTATGLGIMQLAGGLNRIFGIPETKFVYLIIAIVWASIFTASAVSGIDKGIKILSNINIPLCIVICIIVFILGPTAFICNMTSGSFGTMLSEFFKMSFWTDPIDKGGFPQNWTIFYWAWWIASAPSTGLFVAAVSRGRTLKEIVLVHMGFAPVATWLWYGTFGGTAFHFELMENAGLIESMNLNGTGSTVFTLLEMLPLGRVLSIAFLLLVIIFLATTVDSYSYVCAQVSTLKEHNPHIPPKGIRALWACCIAALAVTLVMVGKGISGLQLSSICASTAIMFIMAAMIISMIKDLYSEKRKKERSKKLYTNYNE
ncbi:BCCT family transporter [Maledivibacter halophilus]|uniref:Glycine betaine transporter n=1 Tax=Maledivibacter halophilus TaxID=36842 RepID=A0A1T5IS76_9FIRM|nr:BCCT family transporter [Maledivibacter halophilus]SKC42044.1 glycine betaine transporter [Maledivibacter halophilus]